MLRDLADHITKAGFKYSIKGRPSMSPDLVANIFTWHDLCADKTVGAAKDQGLLFGGSQSRGRTLLSSEASTQMLDTLASDAELDHGAICSFIRVVGGRETVCV